MHQMETKKSIGLILSELRKEKRITGVELADRLGMTKQSVYDTFKNRKSMSLDDLERWAKALEVSAQEIINRSAGDIVLKERSSDNGAFGESILAHIQTLLEEEIREKNNEIREKNDQIKALQEALRESQQMSRVLLGKSPERPDTIVLPHPGTPTASIMRVVGR